MFVAGLLSKGDGSESAKPSTGTSKMSGTITDVPSDPTVVANKAGMQRYARGLNKYKAGQSPTTAYPTQNWTFRPGLSWLGDDEFESTGLAFRLARHQVQRTAALKAAEGRDSKNNTNKNASRGPGPRKSDNQPRVRKKPTGRADKDTQIPQPDQVDFVKTKAPKTAQPSLSKGPVTSYPTVRPSSTPLRVDVNSTDFTSLFGTSPSLPTSPSSISMKRIPTDNAASRLQLALEQYGGDYSNLVSDSLVTSQGSPIAYAQSAMARRRDLGPDRRDIALGIIEGMIGKSQDSRPTA